MGRPKIIIPFSIVNDIIDFYKSNRSISKTSIKFNYGTRIIHDLLRSNNVDTSYPRMKVSNDKRKYPIDSNYFESKKYRIKSIQR